MQELLEDNRNLVAQLEEKHDEINMLKNNFNEISIINDELQQELERPGESPIEEAQEKIQILMFQIEELTNALNEKDDEINNLIDKINVLEYKHID